MAVRSVPSTRSLAVKAAWSIFHRDVVVTGREFWVFLAEVLLQPLATLFIFGSILPGLGMASPEYAKILMPGMVVLTIIITALESMAMPLVIEFGWTKEIEDRLLAPIPVTWVAMEKVFFAALRGLVAGAVIFPLGILIIGSQAVHLTGANLGPVVLDAVLASILGAAIGLMLGTLVRPQQINIMFALILTPMMFTGCTQYPWAELGHLRWFQILTLFNPLTYASESIRAAMVPGLPHMSLVYAIPALILAIILFGVIGIRGFVHRSVD